MEGRKGLRRLRSGAVDRTVGPGSDLVRRTSGSEGEGRRLSIAVRILDSVGVSRRACPVTTAFRSRSRTPFRAVPRMVSRNRRADRSPSRRTRETRPSPSWRVSWDRRTATTGLAIGESSSTLPTPCIDSPRQHPAHSWRFRATEMSREHCQASIATSIALYRARATPWMSPTRRPMSCSSFRDTKISGTHSKRWAFGEGQSERLALESARSPTILRRRLAVMPADREPDWGRDRETAGKVIPAAMIGAWHAASGADREIVSLLADADYEDLESGVADMLRLDDPPLWSIGQYRGVVSRLDALFATAPFVTASRPRPRVPRRRVRPLRDRPRPGPARERTMEGRPFTGSCGTIPTPCDAVYSRL